MPDFHLLGRVQQIGRDEFFVITSAVQCDPPTRALVITRIASTLEHARRDRDRMMIDVGAMVRSEGGRVVDLVEA
jgi:hypothetical protein